MKNRNNQSLYELYTEWKNNHQTLCHFTDHLCDFWYVWGILVFLGIGLLLPFNWKCDLWICRVFIVLLTVLFLLRPMNAVYGLMGTSGSIRVFFFNFLLISFLFSFIYYFGFFKNAGVSYDINQPHIAYDCYPKKNRVTKPEYSIATLIYCTKEGIDCDTVYQKTKIVYQPISYMQVLQNTIITSLMQEPTDLFVEATTYNAGMESNDSNTNSSLNKEKATAFYWILIFQILISWIFFGVFISLLYNKFRYES